MQLIMVRFNSREEGRTALEDIDDARDAKEIQLDDLALVYKTDRGRVKVAQTEDAGLGKGIVRGGVLGLLVGIIAPVAIPGAVVATVAGGALGALVTSFDEGIDNPMMKKLGKNLEGNGSVLLALGSETQVKLLEDGLAPYSDRVEHEVVPEATQDLIKEIAKLAQSELNG